LNTQHIVSDETGVTDVVDPLAGSYFVEYLTNKVEAEAYKILQQIEEEGGMIAAVKSGYIHNMMKSRPGKSRRKWNRRAPHCRVNELVIPPEEEERSPYSRWKPPMRRK